MTLIARSRILALRAMEVRRIHPHEGPRLRALRLSALADAPTAFGSTVAETLAHPREYWDQLARETAIAGTHVRFVAEEDERWYGMVGGLMARDQAGTAQLVSMWVDPTRRREGIGTALVDAVVRWARGCGARRIQLWVTDTNEQAKSLYARNGFVETERTQPLPSNPTLREVLMVRELTSASI